MVYFTINQDTIYNDDSNLTKAMGYILVLLTCSSILRSSLLTYLKEDQDTNSESASLCTVTANTTNLSPVSSFDQ